jgi:hypothetical protein
MRFWPFYISQIEIETAAHDLIERHGEDAHDEAIRLADVGRRFGAARNSAIFRRAARVIVSEQMMAATRVPTDAGRLGKITKLLIKFGSPRVAIETEPND